MSALPWFVGGGLTAGAAWVDARTHTIPPKLIAVGAAGAVGAVLGGWLPPVDLLWGVLVGVAYTILTAPAPDVFGGGDLKLAAMTAVWWGPAAFLVFLAAHVLHGLASLGWWVVRGRSTGPRLGAHAHPWAPFLLLAWVGFTVAAFVGVR